MGRGAEPGLARYARAIEQRWSEIVDRPVVLSPREWNLIGDWHGRGIPLELVRECMEAYAGRPRSRPRRLAYLASAVEEAWSVVVAGRLSGADGGAVGTSPESAAVDGWRARADREPQESALRKLLEELLRRHEAGDDPDQLEEALERRLPEVVPEALLRAVEQELEAELEAYRGRIAPERLETTRRRALAERLRVRLGLLPPGG